VSPRRFAFRPQPSVRPLPGFIGHLLTAASGPSRHFAAAQQFSRFRSEADIQRDANTESDLCQSVSDGLSVSVIAVQTTLCATHIDSSAAL
jgi:hypothetical protein